MQIPTSNASLQTLAEPFPNTAPPTAASAPEAQQSAQHPTVADGSPPAQRTSAWDNPLTRAKREASEKPATPAVTAKSTRLEQVSNPAPETKAAATSPNVLYRVGYSIDAPSPGLNNITFPISISEGQQRKGSKDAGIYYAMMFGVNTDKGGYLGRGYTGIQPREDGKALITFSAYGPHFKAPQGRSEFDGETGVSNSKLVDFKFGNQYNLTVERDPANARLLKAYIQDVTDPDNPLPRQHAGDIYADRDVALAGKDVGFVEHYGAKINKSAQIATTRGSFYAPFTTDENGKVASGKIESQGLSGRFKNSLVGNEEIVKHAKKGDELTFSIAGAGYEKQDEKAAG